MSKYFLRCLGTGDRVQDRYTVRYHETALLRTEYADLTLTPRDLPGLWRWMDWLPVEKMGSQVASSVCYRSEQLADSLGLDNLWVSFHGYWPEREANCPTTTFKDMEAVTTLQRLRDFEVPGMICASAGNTARAFAHFGGLDDYPILLIIAEKHLDRLWVPVDHPTDSVRVIGIAGGDYNEAIEVTSQILEVEGWRREGGVHNVARRDGIGSLLLTAIEEMGAMPDHYFQAVGGGPGPIGVHEMALRAVHSGFAEGPVPRQHVSQNAAFCPIHDAWQARKKHIETTEEAVHPEVYSDFLVNRSPAYDVKGGLYDMLRESDGETYAVDSEEAGLADQLFAHTERIDALSPGAVAVASLQQAISAGKVGKSDRILLNISGGGQERYFEEHETRIIEPLAVTTKEEAVRIGRKLVS